jgi:GGDEF domain-containing protein
MAILSIKRYLNNPSSETALRQAIALLIEKLGACVINGDAQESEDFRDEIWSIHEALTPDLPPEYVLTLAESAARAFEKYNRQMMGAIGKRSSDFQRIIRMLRENLLNIAGENTDSAQFLTSIGEELERGTGFKDLRRLELHLEKCMSNVRGEVEREKAMLETRIERLQIEIENCRRPAEILPQREVDPATGARPKVDCVAAIQQAINRGTRHYAIVMVVNRIQPINARFGRDAGDWMLLRFKEHIESQLLPSDQLFRWTGPAIVAVLERPEGFDYVRGLVKRMLDTRIETTYVIQSRSVLIPISAAWSIFTLPSTAEATEKQIETFIASQGSRDFV